MPKLSVCYKAVLTVLASGVCVGNAAAQPSQTIEFNERFLHRWEDGSKLDLSRFAKKNAPAPGAYVVDLYVNDTFLAKGSVLFARIEDSSLEGVSPCLDLAWVRRINIDESKISIEDRQRLEQKQCVMLPTLVRGAESYFDFGQLRLNITIPEIDLNKTNRHDVVAPEFWDNGVKAAFVRYGWNGYFSHNRGTAGQWSGFLDLNAGVNIGPWRFRHLGNLSYSSGEFSQRSYVSSLTYAYRSIPALRSTLVLGDSYTDSELFQGVTVTGIHMSSDNRMLPEAQRRYVPIVQGMANTNARVQIRRAGSVIYETTVPPGRFEIKDLDQQYGGADLEVVVIEANGSTHSALIPYTVAPHAVHPGVFQYAVSAGSARDQHVPLLQVTARYGLSNTFTLYGGGVVFPDYVATGGGVAANTAFGGMAIDGIYAQTKIKALTETQQGSVIRLSYNKVLTSTNTNFALGAYRYSSPGYLDTASALQLTHTEATLQPIAPPARHRIQLSLYQTLPWTMGSLYATARRQDYWGRQANDVAMQLGYSSHYRALSYTLFVERQRSVTSGNWDKRIMLTFSIPLGPSQMLSGSASTDFKDAQTYQSGVTGVIGQDAALTYSLNASHQTGSNSTTDLSGQVNYRASAAVLQGSLSKGEMYTQAGLGVRGGVLAYANGVIATNMLEEPLAIIEASGATGAHVGNMQQQVDTFGHALVSNLLPFEKNDLDLDPKGAPVNLQLKSTTQQVIPSAGAVVLAKFETERVGTPAIYDIQGTNIPFGTDVLDSYGNIVGVVTQANRLWIRGLKTTHDVLQIRWGEMPNQQCRILFESDPSERANTKVAGSSGIQYRKVTCQPN